MQRGRSLQRLQVIADTKSDLALARLAEVNRQISILESEKQELERRFSHIARSAMTALEVQALGKYRDWMRIRCANLESETARLQDNAAQLKEQARLDFGKSQAIKKLRAQSRNRSSSVA